MKQPPRTDILSYDSSPNINSLRCCSRCISDTSIPGIQFDDRGICNFCKAHDELEKLYPLNEIGQKKLNHLLDKIRSKGKNKKYDCIVGVSGGTDSTYCLYLAKKFGLRPLAVHLDNGWDTEIAQDNIKKVTTKLGVELKTVSCNWEEFKDLQVSFLKASVSDAEIPTDIAIAGVLYRVAVEEGIHYVLNGHSFRAEGLSPTGWTYMDGKYIKSIFKRFGKTTLENFPNLTIYEMFYYTIIKRIRVVPLLAYINYSKEESKKILADELDWTYYGGHHFESIYTRFVITNLLLKKFKIDKRIVEYSAYVRSGHMTREQALEVIKEAIPEDKEIAEYCRDKLGFTAEEFEAIWSSEPRTFLDYPTYFPIIKMMGFPIKIACRLGLLPHIFYQKYFNWDYRALKTHYSR